ncbi:hypothetical protein RHSIM_RhsimUnG0041100 [Rhododendron simsii]|uniref:DUF4378 domain-containing protein n=1 Tax=Rhododendron simsii TaxID=118357 RepID=A0A834L4W0_RHOSS|nr:hypothetical protein RHSIM_RhsimUnG0123100 [Rhododendron simsii]KAF7116031.1 hypothetical protein RHSIM_RhsimUnG0041100 [Rhododendron simsii]
MASLSQQVSMKRLAQLLEEKQEPFALEVYLSERRYRKKSSRSDSNGFKLGNLAKTVNRSGDNQVTGRTAIPDGSPILRLAINKLISNKYFQKLVHHKNKAQQDRGKQVYGNAKKQENNAARNRPSTSRGKSLIHVSSEGDAKMHFHCPRQNHWCTFQALKLDNLNELEAATDTNQWGYMEDSKQLSPVSVLEELPPDGYRAYDRYSQLHFQMKEKSPHFPKPKLLSMQRKQLLIRKVTKEFRKAICDQISSLGKQYGDVKTIKHLIHLDFSDTTAEWKDFQLVQEKIGIEIADTILYDIVMEMIIADAILYI